MCCWHLETLTPKPWGGRGGCHLARPHFPQLLCQPPVFSLAGDQETQRADERHRKGPQGEVDQREDAEDQRGHRQRWASRPGPRGSCGVSEGSSFSGRVVRPRAWLRQVDRPGVHLAGSERDGPAPSPGPLSPPASRGARRAGAQDGGPGFSATRHCPFSLAREWPKGRWGPALLPWDSLLSGAWVPPGRDPTGQSDGGRGFTVLQAGRSTMGPGGLSCILAGVPRVAWGQSPGWTAALES